MLFEISLQHTENCQSVSMLISELEDQTIARCYRR